MTDTDNSEARKNAEKWMRSSFDAAVQMIMDVGAVSGDVVEARPSWMLPYRLVIGQVRESAGHEHFTWVIGGELSTDHISSRVAPTARDAARHFALKWQMNAEKFRDPAHRRRLGLAEDTDWSAECDKVSQQAEELYDIAEDDALWES